MASFNVAQLSNLLKKMETKEEILQVLRNMAFLRIPSEVAKELKLVEILTPLMAQKKLNMPVKMILAKLKFNEEKAAEVAAPVADKKTSVKKDKKESRKRKASTASEESKAPKKRKSAEQKETVVPKKKETKPKKAQPTPLMKKCLKQARGMFSW